jgi:hypothetical protein
MKTGEIKGSACVPADLHCRISVRSMAPSALLVHAWLPA